eukprot:TRINITY_DN2125_c1_g1_i2.p2 TRINITY_DN2125_c1_g1~~TRINITY_DN2125_c1_g1_i2.p2  ORF type:complete len:138 (+),score=19.56 TRINITY_DN2125_c1_g1_i2:164-577(+)
MTECPICLGSLCDAVEIGCGHALCGGCLLALVRGVRPWLCPLCREQIATQHPSFALRGLLHNDSTDQRAIDAELRGISFAGGPLSLSSLSHDLKRWLTVFMFLLYLISPIDLFPDTIPVIGFIDDLLLLGLLLYNNR